MYVKNIREIDDQGRINISAMSKEFSNNPQRLLMVFDPNMEMIKIISGEKAEQDPSSVELDKKGRVSIPKWIRDILPSNKLLFIEDSGEYYLSPQTGKLL